MLNSTIHVGPILSLISIIILNFLISGYNAALIGLSSKELPVEYQENFLRLGAGGAVILRIIFTVLALFFANLPYFEAAGGLILLWMAWQLFSSQDDVMKTKSFVNRHQVLLTIFTMNILLSFANVAAVVEAAKGNIYLVIFGLIYSLPILIFGHNWLIQWKTELPTFVQLSIAFIVFTLVQMILNDHGFLLLRLVGQPLAILLPWILAGLVFIIRVVLKSQGYSNSTLDS